MFLPINMRLDVSNHAAHNSPSLNLFIISGLCRYVSF